jgi:hypothetical protein
LGVIFLGSLGSLGFFHWIKSSLNLKTQSQKEQELFYLPSYSPEINPDEYLNNDLKSGIGLKPTPKNHKQMKSNVKSHMIFLQKNAKRVARFFHHKSIKYVAA